MTRESDHSRGRLGKCPGCKARVWRARWVGLTIDLAPEPTTEIPPVGKGIGAMEWNAAVGEWTGARPGTDNEVRLVHNCPSAELGTIPRQPSRDNDARSSAGRSERGSETTSMSSDPWESPGSTSGIDFEELKGRLLIITPHAAEEVNTSFGEKECVRADLVVLDGPAAGAEYRDTLIFPKVLIGQLRTNIGTGRMVLGRLGQGNAKPGQKPPWLLADPEDADRKIARAWYEAAQTKKLPF